MLMLPVGGHAIIGRKDEVVESRTIRTDDLEKRFPVSATMPLRFWQARQIVQMFPLLRVYKLESIEHEELKE